MSDSDEPLLWAIVGMMIHTHDSYQNELDPVSKDILKDTALTNAQLVLSYDTTEGEQTWTNLAQLPETINCFSTAATIFAMFDNRDEIIECHRRMTAHINRLMPAIPDIQDWLS